VRWRVLVVEDDDSFAEMLAAVLESDGRFAITAHARDGAEGVALSRALRPDVILMDIEMPLVDGVEATRRIIAERPVTRVIAVSGSDYSERALEARLAGAYDYVRKSRIHEDLVDAAVAAVSPRCGR
jgi:CheY-like chemotaxis protein